MDEMVEKSGGFRKKVALILTAIDTETNSVLRHLGNASREQVGSTWFHTGEFECWKIVVAETGMGNNRAATIAARSLSHFHPQIAAFVGIAGGLKDVKLGDVVVATKVYGFESGKQSTRSFLPRPDVRSSHYELEQRARLLRTTTSWHARLDAKLMGR